MAQRSTSHDTRITVRREGEALAETRCVGRQQDHLQASFRQNATYLKAIGFGLAKSIDDLKQHRRCRVAFEPIINDFKGRRSAEMQIRDLKFPTQGEIHEEGRPKTPYLRP